MSSYIYYLQFNYTAHTPPNPSDMTVFPLYYAPCFQVQLLQSILKGAKLNFFPGILSFTYPPKTALLYYATLKSRCLRTSLLFYLFI